MVALKLETKYGFWKGQNFASVFHSSATEVTPKASIIILSEGKDENPQQVTYPAQPPISICSCPHLLLLHLALGALPKVCRGILQDSKEQSLWSKQQTGS